MIRRIHVKMHLTAPEDAREAAERVHGFYADYCPVYRTLKGSIQMTTELVFHDLDGSGQNLPLEKPSDSTPRA